MRRTPAYALVALVLAGCGAERPGTASTPSLRGRPLAPSEPAPRFTLRDQHGKRFGPQSLAGKWFVVAFLYTHCPDVCPLIANQLAAAQRRVPDLHVLAISVDPKGDTPRSVRTFIEQHDLGPRFTYVTGSQARLAPVWRRYHVASLAGPRAVVSHSAFELLVDPRGRERVLYDSKVQAADLAHDPLVEARW